MCAHTKSEHRRSLAWRYSVASLLWAIGSLLGACGGDGSDGVAEDGRPNIVTVFQTTFNCPDWIQDATTPGSGLDANVCSAGDGIAGSGDWTTSSGSRDQITTAANNPSGGGGKGFRHWRGDGDNNTGGGLVITLPAPVTEVWVRFYMRYQAGFDWTGTNPTYTKDHYWNGPGCGGAGDCVIFGHQGGGWGISDNNSNLGGSETWFDTMGGETGDGQWHCYEYHVQKAGASSVVQVWVDGVQTLNMTANMGSATLTHFILGENQRTVTGAGTADYYTDYDDIAVSTSGYIGPL